MILIPRDGRTPAIHSLSMKIALDATPLTVPSGGVRRYTEELTRALCDTFADDQFWLLSDQKPELPFHRRNLRAGLGPRNMLERRWFAVQSATRTLQSECDLLLEALNLAQAAWQRANQQLAEFEALGDALESEMAAMQDMSLAPAMREDRCLEMSAA